jgi:hypothetical protein
MARKRMFDIEIIDTDLFLEMPISTRLLYYDLSMRADDDGFISNYKKILRMTGTSEDDLKILLTKQYILPFDTGVIVIKHWKINNYLRKDRYTQTLYKEEKKQLEEDENGAYLLSRYTSGIPVVYTEEKRIEEISIDKKENIKRKKYGEYQKVLLTDEEYSKLLTEYGSSLTNNLITYLDEYIEMKGYKAKNHYLCIKKWVIKAVKGNENKVPEWMNKEIEVEKYDRETIELAEKIRNAK